MTRSSTVTSLKKEIDMKTDEKKYKYNLMWDDNMLTFAIFDQHDECLSAGNVVHDATDDDFNFKEFERVLRQECDYLEIDIADVDADSM